ncbi:unnamed protein product [Merluccius merluccius]
MNNRSIAWWLRKIGLPQYTKTLESEYYGLEGLLTVTDEELKEAGVEDPTHRATILSQLLRHKPILDPYSGLLVVYLQVRNRKDVFRQSFMHRLHRADKNTVSASCSQLHPLTEDTDLAQASKQSSQHSLNISLTHRLSA